ncbi:uridylate kinase [Thiohalobacter sp. COW1]|uniref:Uridylate kinase n=1 Tax=Thiohalobacter thiocyanaticus TaxID=585455 RepID=A0A1Z4VSY8_9GAMM|nr:MULTISPECIES: UMP kinase [Thiohalobacter]BAZ94458.1 uridylate kinase [Thiohalobacter thiocyanaticus]BCO30473.1 uridylate kinase [Thiohalobacter sp. COW1]
MPDTYRRILLKLSGEALMGPMESGIDPATLNRFATEISDLLKEGVQVGLVIGGGNIFRGAGLAAAGMDRVKGDQMGMLATVMNSLAMQDALIRLGSPCRLMTAFSVGTLSEPFDRDRAIRHLEQGRAVIFAGGTGNPYFTTDSAASLRAIEIQADILFKATQVDGVYSDDPKRNPDAERFEHLSYDEAIDRRLMVMDTTALALCRENRLPLQVFNIHEPGNLRRAATGEAIGTRVE